MYKESKLLPVARTLHNVMTNSQTAEIVLTLITHSTLFLIQDTYTVHNNNKQVHSVQLFAKV